jgi:hypothetical protein
LFVELDDQAEVLIALYKMIFPDWEDIEELQGWPAINNYTWEEIAFLFVEFDKIYHPKVFAGGCWVNRGFTIGEAPNWTADLSRCEIVYKPSVLVADIYNVMEGKF